jgi:CRP-like cAMP-binding protein
VPPSELVLTDSERRLALRRMAGFDRLGSEELAAIAKRTRRHELAPEELLVSPEQPRTSAHLLVSGELELRRGERAWTWTPAHPLDLFWLARDTAPLEARAKSGVVTLALDFDELEELLADHFPLWLGTTGDVARALLDLGPRLPPNPARVARVRAPLTTDRFSARLVALRAGLAFAGGAIEALAQLADAAVEVVFPRDATLWHEGDAASRLIVPVEGALRGLSDDEVGALGSLELLAERPHRATIVAVTEVRALSIEGEDLLDVLEDHQDLARDCVALLAGTLIRRLER